MVSVIKLADKTVELMYAKEAKSIHQEIEMTFQADRIVDRRDLLNLKQEDLAQKLGVSQQQVSGYEKGLHKPSMEMLIKIAEALECSTDYLLGLTDVPYLLGSLTDDERFVLERYRSMRVTAQNDAINEGVAKLANPLRDQVKRIVARLLEQQGKFDNRSQNS